MVSSETSINFPPRSAVHADLVRRSLDVVPGGTFNALVLPKGEEFIVTRGEGAWLIDFDGRRFLDFQLGGGPLILGHAHPAIVKALTAALSRGTHHLVTNNRAVELAERVVRMVPCAEMVRFLSSGSEAVFHALRLARAATGRRRILKFEGAYHGHLELATVSLGPHAPGASYPAGVPGSQGMSPATLEEVQVLPYNDVGMLRDFMTREGHDIAAVITEPYQRMLSPIPGFLEEMRAACDKAGAVLIFDEVVTGFRFGPGGAQKLTGVIPDLAVFGKAMSGGLPLSAVAGKRKLMERFAPQMPSDVRVFQCGTLNGNMLAVESAHACLDELDRAGGYRYLDELGRETRAMIGRLASKAGIECFVAGAGPMFHPYFTSAPVIQAADLHRCDMRRSEKFHLALMARGVYKPFEKGYLSLVHGASEMKVAERVFAEAFHIAVQ